MKIVKPKYLVILLSVCVLAIFIFKPIQGYWYQYQAGKFWAKIISDNYEDQGLFICARDEVKNDKTRNDIIKALNYYKKAVQIFPKQSYLHLQQGKAYCLLNDYKSAYQELRQYTILRPENPLGFIELGFVILNQGTMVDATRVNSEIIQSSGLSSSVLAKNGDYELINRNYENAIKWYIFAEKMGANITSSFNYAKYLNFIDKGSQNNSIEYLLSAINNEQGWSDPSIEFLAMYTYGRVLFEAKDYEQSEIILSRAIAINSSSKKMYESKSEAYRFLGESQWSQNKLQEAVKSMMNSIELYKNNVWANIHIGKILYQLDKNNKDVTQQYFIAALSIKKLDESIWQNLIDFWFNSGETKELSDLCNFIANQNSGYIANHCD